MAAINPFARDGSCVSVHLAVAGTGECPAPADHILINAHFAGVTGRAGLSIGTIETTSGRVLAHASGTFYRTTSPLPTPTNGPQPGTLQESGLPLDAALGLKTTSKGEVRTSHAHTGSMWQLRNPTDNLHGGVQMAMIEVEARRVAAAVWGDDVVAHRVDISHLKPCPADSAITLTTALVHRGNNVIHTRTVLRDDHGDVVSAGDAVVLRQTAT